MKQLYIYSRIYRTKISFYGYFKMNELSLVEFYLEKEVRFYFDAYSEYQMLQISVYSANLFG